MGGAASTSRVDPALLSGAEAQDAGITAKVAGERLNALDDLSSAGQIEPALAARYLASRAKQTQLNSNGKASIMYENAMGNVNAEQAKELVSSFEQIDALRRWVIKGDDTAAPVSPSKAATDMRRKIELTLLESKASGAVARWAHQHRHNERHSHGHHHGGHHHHHHHHDPASFFDTSLGAAVRTELRYDICDDFDFDGTTMHAAGSTVRYTERVGLRHDVTAFESNCAADSEEKARELEEVCKVKRRAVEAKAKALRSQCKATQKEVQSATLAKQPFKAAEATRTLDALTDKLNATTKQSSTLEAQSRAYKAQKEKSEASWIDMATSTCFRSSKRAPWSRRDGPAQVAAVEQYCGEAARRAAAGDAAAAAPARLLSWGVVAASVVAGVERTPESLRRLQEELVPLVSYVELGSVDSEASESSGCAPGTALGRALSHKAPHAGSTLLSRHCTELDPVVHATTAEHRFAHPRTVDPASTPVAGAADSFPIDYFVVHCAADDAAGQEKACVLDKLAQEFVQQHGRAPRVWIDKACADQFEPTQLAALLPVAMMASRRVLLLYSDGCRRDLWVLYALYLHAALSTALDPTGGHGHGHGHGHDSRAFSQRIEVVNLLSDRAVEERENWTKFRPLSEAQYERAKTLVKTQAPVVRSALSACPGGTPVLLKWINTVLKHCFELAIADPGHDHHNHQQQ